jgi:SET domain-containing protein 6
MLPIWQFNTYGSPANSYLLRKYGHVDVYPLRDDIVSELPEEYKIWPMGNEGDEVEITGDVVVQAALRVWSIAAGGKTLKSQEEEEQRKQVLSERVDWWLEEGEEECVCVFHIPMQKHVTYKLGLTVLSF